MINEKNFGWSYGFWQNHEGYVGQTPERIVEWKNKKLQTTALAGTFTKVQNATSEILKDEKNMEEHQIVVDDILEKLKNLSFIQNLEKNKTEAVELKHLIHLKTEFQMNTNKIEEAFEVVQALHPTAALGVYPPNLDAYTALQNMQSDLSRKNFAAPFCFINQNELFCVAAIRNFYFNSSEIKIVSGCGVTARSEYEKELTELMNKRQSVKKMMGLGD